MFFANISYLTVIIAGVASIALGFAWYSPALFGKRFMKEMKVTAEQIAEYKKNDSPAKMAKMYGPVFIVALLSAFIISALLNSLVVTSIHALITLALSVWAGFSLPVAINSVVFGKDSKALMLINTGYQLVNITLVTLIIGIWG